MPINGTATTQTTATQAPGGVQAGAQSSAVAIQMKPLLGEQKYKYSRLNLTTSKFTIEHRRHLSDLSVRAATRLLHLLSHLFFIVSPFAR